MYFCPQKLPFKNTYRTQENTCSEHLRSLKTKRTKKTTKIPYIQLVFYFTTQLRGEWIMMMGIEIWVHCTRLDKQLLCIVFRWRPQFFCVRAHFEWIITVLVYQQSKMWWFILSKNDSLFVSCISGYFLPTFSIQFKGKRKRAHSFGWWWTRKNQKCWIEGENEPNSLESNLLHAKKKSRNDVENLITITI